MFKVVVLFAVFSNSNLCAPGIQGHKSEAEYNYEIKIHDPQTGGISTQRQGRLGGVTQGKYTLFEKDGSSRKVEYRIGNKKSGSFGGGFLSRINDPDYFQDNSFYGGPDSKESYFFQSGNIQSRLSNFRPSQPLTENPYTFRPIPNPHFNSLHVFSFPFISDYDYFPLQSETDPFQLISSYDEPFADFHHALPSYAKTGSDLLQFEYPLSEQNYQPSGFSDNKKNLETYPKSSQRRDYLKPVANKNYQITGESKSYSNYITKEGKNYLDFQKAKAQNGQSSLGFNQVKPKLERSDILKHQHSETHLPYNQRWRSDNPPTPASELRTYSKKQDSLISRPLKACDLSVRNYHTLHDGNRQLTSASDIYDLNYADPISNLNSESLKSNYDNGFSNLNNLYDISDLSFGSLSNNYRTPEFTPIQKASSHNGSQSPHHGVAVSTFKLLREGTNVETLTKHKVTPKKNSGSA